MGILARSIYKKGLSMKFEELDLFMLMNASDIEYSNLPEDMIDAK